MCTHNITISGFPALEMSHSGLVYPVSSGICSPVSHIVARFHHTQSHVCKGNTPFKLKMRPMRTLPMSVYPGP